MDPLFISREKEKLGNFPHLKSLQYLLSEILLFLWTVMTVSKWECLFCLSLSQVGSWMVLPGAFPSNNESKILFSFQCVSLSQNILLLLKLIGERKEVKHFKESFMAGTEKGIITSAHLPLFNKQSYVPNAIKRIIRKTRLVNIEPISAQLTLLRKKHLFYSPSHTALSLSGQ